MANFFKKNTYIRYLTASATLLAAIVILLGAYTRLSDAGLGCPDWPGCYGHWAVPESHQALKQVAKAYPGIQVEAMKAWAEMIHRYVAGLLGFLILIIAFIASLRRFFDASTSLTLPLSLVAMLAFQAALGMWTVTWKLLPLVVMGHLLGGMTIISMLWWITLTKNQKMPMPLGGLYSPNRTLLFAGIVGLVILVLQIILGGWTSSNYAALACTDLPLCHGKYFPAMNFSQGFNFLSPVGANYEGGTLGMSARLAIHMTHRYWACITAIYLGTFAFRLFIKPPFRQLGIWLFMVLSLQITLGILNIAWLLPKSIAVAHNGFAVLLLLSLITIIHRLRSA